MPPRGRPIPIGIKPSGILLSSALSDPTHIIDNTKNSKGSILKNK